MEIEIITRWLDMIPKSIEVVRNLITKIIETINLPVDPTYTLVILAVSLILGYYWIKQFITYNVFTKISTLLNYLLLALIIYVIFTYV